MNLDRRSEVPGWGCRTPAPMDVPRSGERPPRPSMQERGLRCQRQLADLFEEDRPLRLLVNLLVECLPPTIADVLQPQREAEEGSALAERATAVPTSGLRHPTWPSTTWSAGATSTGHVRRHARHRASRRSRGSPWPGSHAGQPGSQRRGAGGNVTRGSTLGRPTVATRHGSGHREP